MLKKKMILAVASLTTINGVNAGCYEAPKVRPAAHKVEVCKPAAPKSNFRPQMTVEGQWGSAKRLQHGEVSAFIPWSRSGFVFGPDFRARVNGTEALAFAGGLTIGGLLSNKIGGRVFGYGHSTRVGCAIKADSNNRWVHGVTVGGEVFAYHVTGAVRGQFRTSKEEQYVAILQGNEQGEFSKIHEIETANSLKATHLFEAEIGPWLQFGSKVRGKALVGGYILGEIGKEHAYGFLGRTELSHVGSALETTFGMEARYDKQNEWRFMFSVRVGNSNKTRVEKGDFRTRILIELHTRPYLPTAMSFVRVENENEPQDVTANRPCDEVNGGDVQMLDLSACVNTAQGEILGQFGGRIETVTWDDNGTLNGRVKVFAGQYTNPPLAQDGATVVFPGGTFTQGQIANIDLILNNVALARNGDTACLQALANEYAAAFTDITFPAP